MQTFPDWFTQQMDDIGYALEQATDFTAEEWLTFKDNDEQFHVVYLKTPPDAEHLRGIFTAFQMPVLFIVDKSLLPEPDPMYHYANTILPLWLRALHAVYYGRIYCWTGDGISALHVQWTNGTAQWSEPIDITGILFTHTDSKLYEFKGLFHIARFYDKAFWKNPPREQEPKRYQRRTDAPPPRPQSEASNDFYHLLLKCNSLQEMKRKYRELAREWHPDLNPGKPQATVNMQLINSAFDRAKVLYS